MSENFKPPYSITRSPATPHSAESWTVSGRSFGVRSYPSEDEAIQAAQDYYGETPKAEVVIHLFSKRTQTSVRAREGVEPAKLLEQAIAALRSEYDELSKCPAHAAPGGGVNG